MLNFTHMKIFLDDSDCREQLFPFTHIRHVAEIRIGILTIREKWEKLTGEYIYTTIQDKDDKFLKIKANIIPTQNNYKSILGISSGITVDTDIRSLEHPWQIFQFNDWALREDFELLTRYKISRPISKTNHCVHEDQIFVSENVEMEHCILNASTGPIYLGKDATIMEGTMIRGPFAAGEGATLKMGTKVYGATTIGPKCIAGGEIKNSVIFGHSNKAHDGYLGDSVIGEWCNLGAGTSNSNIKNTAGEVKYQLTADSKPGTAGVKGGLLMGDYSRAAINTSFNTGSVVGVCCNIFGRQFPGRYTPNFAWGDDKYEFEKAIRDIGNWKQLKGQTVSESETELLKELYSLNL